MTSSRGADHGAIGDHVEPARVGTTLAILGRSQTAGIRLRNPAGVSRPRPDGPREGAVSIIELENPLGHADVEPEKIAASAVRVWHRVMTSGPSIQVPAGNLFRIPPSVFDVGPACVSVDHGE
jgi:hypothetical protein